MGKNEQTSPEMWNQIIQSNNTYKCFPRSLETGGAEEILKMAKNFPEVMRFIK